MKDNYNEFKRIMESRLKLLSRLKKTGITLLELIIALILLGLFVIAFLSIDIFTRHHVRSSERLAQVQNEVSLVLSHMSKFVTGTNARGGAVGDVNHPVIDRSNIAGDTAIAFWVDSNPQNGRRDATDTRIAYRYNAANREIWFYPNYVNAGSSHEVIARNITSNLGPAFLTYDDTEADSDPIDNFFSITVVGCWDPDGVPNPCGTPENPQVTLHSNIKMPSVSVH